MSSVAFVSRTLKCVLAGMLLFVAALASAQGGGFAGRVYDDWNGNGHHDQGEPGRADQVMRVTNVAFPGMTFEVVSREDGAFGKGNLEAGRYAIHPGVAIDMELTEPSLGGFVFVNVQPGAVANAGEIGIGEKCAKIKTDKLLCLTDGTGCFMWTFTIKNLSAFPIVHIFFQPTGGVSIQSNLTNLPNYIPVNPPIPPGGERTFTVKLCGVLPNTDICIPMSVHSYNLAECCATSACFRTPPCDCMQFLEEAVTCNADGSFTYTYCVQNLTPYLVKYILFAPANGDVQMTPNFVDVGTPIGYGGVYCGQFTLPATSGGRPYYFYIGFADRFFQMCCSIQQCIALPECGGCVELPGICAAGKPNYQDPTYGGFTGTIAAVTTDDIWGAASNVLHIMNLSGYQCNPPPLGFQWSTQTPYKWNGPGNAWNKSELGSIFGLTIDPQGNIYVAYSSSYSNDSVGTVGVLGSGVRQGCVYKIPNGTGIPTLFTATSLPNSTSGPLTEFAGLGNITYDYDNNQFFVTNMDDGKIYRLDLAGNYVATQAFDPLTPDNGAAGFAPLGERLWGVEYHRGRVYYSVWAEDGGRPSTTMDNSIRSVAISNTGAFIAGTDRLEVVMPPIQNSYSEPVSDISFSPEGYMGIAERTMWGDSNNGAHSSRGLEFRCRNGKWVLYTGPDSNAYVGQDVFRMRTSSAGGMDYDYSQLCSNQLPTLGRRIWWTADCQQSAPGGGCDVYGLTGLRINGSGLNENIYYDMNNDVTVQDKMLLGDVEIPCSSDGFVGRPAGFEVTKGSIFSGGLDEILHSDDVSLQVLNDDATFVTQIVFYSMGVPDGLDELRFKFEGHTGRPGLYQAVAWFNYLSGQWLTLDSRMAPTSDVTIEVTVASNLARFIGPDGEVKARTTWAPYNDEDPTQDGWLSSVDCACWESN